MCRAAVEEHGCFTRFERLSVGDESNVRKGGWDCVIPCRLAPVWRTWQRYCLVRSLKRERVRDVGQTRLTAGEREQCRRFSVSMVTFFLCCVISSLFCCSSGRRLFILTRSDGPTADKRHRCFFFLRPLSLLFSHACHGYICAVFSSIFFGSFLRFSCIFSFFLFLSSLLPPPPSLHPSLFLYPSPLFS